MRHLHRKATLNMPLVTKHNHNVVLCDATNLPDDRSVPFEADVSRDCGIGDYFKDRQCH